MRAAARPHMSGAVLAALLAAAVPATAHSPLAATVPPDGARPAVTPPAVTATYGEPVARVGDAVVTGPAGRSEVTAARVPGDARRVRITVPPAGPGTYRVTWVAVSADGHRSRAGITFRVRVPAVSRTLLRLSARVRDTAARVARAAPR
ncbi:MAG: copper resistance protein CopC [Thermoleophilia bacterium]